MDEKSSLTLEKKKLYQWTELNILAQFFRLMVEKPLFQMKRRFLRLRNNTPFREKEGIDRVIEPLAMSNGIIISQKSAT